MLANDHPSAFIAYLTSKKIDAGQFAATEPGVYAEWEADFEQMHSNSFTVSKKFILNLIRRKYLLK